MLGWDELINESLTELITQIGRFLPNLLGAVLLLIFGWLVARLSRSITIRVLQFVGVRRFARQTKVNETLESAGISITLSEILAQAVYWIILLMFLTAASNTLGLPFVAEAVNSIVAYVPNAIAALLIIIITLTAARITRDLIRVSLKQLNVLYGGAIATLIASIIFLFGLFTAINQLGIDISLLTDNFTIVLIGFVATFGSSFALGSRNTIANLIAGYYVQRSLKIGQDITLAGIKGKIKEINATAVILETEEGDKIVPNDKVISEGS